MRFAAASRNKASNYATAGAYIVDASADIQQAIANRKPDYAGIAATAMDASSLEKRAALQAKTAVDTAGLKAVADVKQTQLTSDARVAAAQSMADAKIKVAEMEADVQELRNNRKMAGKLSAIGTLMAKNLIKPKKVDPPEYEGIGVSTHIEETQAKIAELQKQMEEFNKSTGSPTTESTLTTPTTPTTTTTTTTTSHKIGDDGLYTVGIVELGNRLRDNFGLRVVEHPKFGGVTDVHAPNSHHDYGEAIDIQDWRDDVINGVHWKDRTRNLRNLLRGSGHEVLGPGDPNHDTHVHLGNYGGTFSLNQQQYDYLFGGNSGGRNATFILNNY